MDNAGIYDGILAAGLAWAPPTGESAHDVTRALLAGAAVAGLFGAVTIKSAPTAVYAALGIVGLLIILTVHKIDLTADSEKATVTETVASPRSLSAF